MTLRAKPVTRRPGRSGWDHDERRTAMINGAFIGAIILSVLLLIGYGAWSWYDSHFGTAATVDGVVINKDQLRTRYAIETFRIDYTEARVRTLLTAGRISDLTAQQQISFLEQRRQVLGDLALERLIDNQVQAKLAADDGIAVADADVDAQLTVEATIPEERHAWVIEVKPETDPATGVSSDAQKAAAKQKAEAALAAIKGGKAWEDVAKTDSTGSTAAQGGDLSYVRADDSYDKAWLKAVFELQANGMTDVVAGSDGVFRIGRITDIAAVQVDGTFQSQIEAAGIKMDDYRVAVKGDVTRIKLSDKVTADLSQPQKQRHVLQIYFPEEQVSPDAVKVRHILFAPNDDAAAAQKLPETDPAWETAHQAAEAAYQELLKDPSKFDAMARTISDENSAKTTGGKQPWYDPTSAIDNAFAAQIFKDGLKPGQILPPFKSSFGWHVVQFLRPYGDGPEAWAADLKTQLDAGADFRSLARDNDEGDLAQKGGDIGWVFEKQFGDTKSGPIFDTPLNKPSDVAVVSGDGVYLFLSIEEQASRPLTDDQLAIVQSNGFSDWYSLKKAAVKITRDAASAASALQ
jgi:parvulin-like peptidyl-prolyl isomerase